MDPDRLVRDFDPDTGFANPDSVGEKRLSDLSGVFADEAAYAAACREADPLVYSVQVFAPGGGEGDLHLGYGRILPGAVGGEFFMTRGHVHARIDMAEIYLGLRGRGLMLLQAVDGGTARTLELAPGRAVYVPGSTAHRTINTGPEPLAYFGIYSAVAGHDYERWAEEGGFDVVVVKGGDGPAVLPREEALRMR